MQSRVSEWDSELSFGGGLDACGKGAIRSLELAMLVRAMIGGKRESGAEKTATAKIIFGSFAAKQL